MSGIRRLSAPVVPAAKTANYALTATDDTVLFNGTTLTATLPSAVTAGSGKKFTVKNMNTSPLTLASAGGTIDGNTTVTLAQFYAYTVASDGTNWMVV